MKKCTKCYKLKPLDRYPKDKKMTSGLGSWCRDCLNEYKRKDYDLNKVEYLEEARLERLANPQKARIQEKAWRDSNKSRMKGYQLKQYWPELTWAEALTKFEELAQKQDNKCAICKKPEYRTYNRPPYQIRDLCVDHCHTTKIVRGLLCDDCNVLIGRANDKPEVCIQAASYLKKSIA